MPKKEIHLLPPQIINKIAAGEVVERPASVVKELVENAIDAGASSISVKIEKGGNQLIAVSDNGTGMDRKNAELAFLQHATSKIASEDDLFKIGTLGFRGEALASIASVSNASIHTFDGNSHPINVTVVNGQIKTSLGQARKTGTTVTVRNIFFKIPARRKFLRLENTEYKYVVETFISLALANPKISFKLQKEGKIVYDFKSVTALRQRIEQIFPNLAAKLLPIQYQDHELKIEGAIGHPDLAKNYQQPQYIFLNSRPVKDQLLNKAVRDGFSTTLMKGMFPMYFLYLTLNTELFDVNVHPRKTEVKFYSPQKVFHAVKHTVSGVLEKNLQTEFKNRINLGNKNNTPVVFPKIEHVNNFTQEPIDYTPKFTLPEKPEAIELDFFERETSKFLQIFNTYLISQREGKLVIIDQHAADERVNYEKINKEFATADKIASIPLLIAAKLVLNPSEEIVVRKFQNTLHQIGFTIKNVSNKEFQLTRIPTFLQDHDYISAFKEIISDLEDFTEPKAALAKATHKIISTIACHASIRAGQRLNTQAIQHLITNLFNCELPYSCPHGRPIIWELSRAELEKKFKRKL